MKGSNGGASMLYVMVILFGCLAVSAQCRSQKLEKVERTRGVYLTGNASNTSAYHSEIQCPSDVVVDNDESKVKLIFCTVKCYCHGVHGDAICYCCQKPPGKVCYEHLADCQANCPICNPQCPHGAATTTNDESIS